VLPADLDALQVAGFGGFERLATPEPPIREQRPVGEDAEGEPIGDPRTVGELDPTP
jgi:hypothetical protein